MKPRALPGAGLLIVTLALGTTAAQEPGAEVFRGGVPSGSPTPDVMALTLDDAIARGLQRNLGLILGQEAVQAADGAWREARADLLPQVRAGASAVRQKISLAAFGFSGFPGFPEVIGPFNVVDARGYLSQSVLDFYALRHTRAAAFGKTAAEQEQRSIRDTVVLACAALYLQAMAEESRTTAVSAQLATAQALYDLASDRKKAGLTPGIDVLRAQVALEAQRQRLIVAQTDAAKQKLALARAIGLPLGQAFRLADEMPFAPMPALTAEEALRQAYANRADLQAAESRVRAAEEARRAAAGQGLPSLGIGGDYGAIGNDVSSARATYTMAVGLRIPVFEGGRVQAKVEEAAARLKQEQARLADLRAHVYYEIQSTLLDLRATEERVGVAGSALDLARRQLEQAQDRFAAGVAGNIDVTQAQEAEARATEDQITSLFEHNVAKASLARALGMAESSYGELLRGRK
jgi:outer membrane protein TolC